MFNDVYLMSHCSSSYLFEFLLILCLSKPFFKLYLTGIHHGEIEQASLFMQEKGVDQNVTIVGG